MLIIVNALLYWITFIFYQIKKKRFDLGSLLLLVFAISFSSSIYFFLNTNIDFTKYSILPSLYLYICIMISIYPILRYNEGIKIRKIKTHNNEIIIEAVIIIFAISSIIPFVENLFLCLKSSSDSSSYSIGSIYENSIDIDQGLSWVGRKLNWLINTFQYVIPVLFFYELSKPKIRKLILIGLILAVLSTVLNAYANASRVGIVRILFYFILSYFLSRSFLDLKKKKIFKKVGFLFVSLIIGLVLLVTIARFNYDTTGKIQNEDNPLLTWVSLYTGEGSLRFNTQMWHVNSHSNGDNCFSFVKDSFGFPTFIDNDKRRSYYASNMHIQTEVFYTFIGDFYSDFGKIGTFLLVILLSVLLQKILVKLRYGNIETIIIAALILNIYIFGFTYFPYKTYQAQSVLFINLMFCLLLYVNRKIFIK